MSWPALLRNTELAELGRREKMRTRLIVAAMALAVCAQATSVSGRKATGSAFSRDALEPGAVYETSLRVSGNDVEQYLSLYAKWFLHVDMAPNSGRKLLTVLSREVGDGHSLVFLYWYESRYKEQYYCRYAREFFTYHLGNEATRAELRTIYDNSSRLLGQPRWDDDAIRNALGPCQGNEVPPAIAETIRKVEEPLRRLSVSEEDSWNVGVNPCRVQKISDAEKNHSTITALDLERCETSLLERTVSKKPGQ